MAKIPAEGERTRKYIDQMVLGLILLSEQQPWAKAKTTRVLEALEHYWPATGGCSSNGYQSVVMALTALRNVLDPGDKFELMVTVHARGFKQNYAERPGRGRRLGE